MEVRAEPKKGAKKARRRREGEKRECRGFGAKFCLRSISKSTISTKILRSAEILF